VTSVCLAANTLYYPEGGGHRWVYLQWALGLVEAGCRVVWLENVSVDTPAADVARLVQALRADLAPFGLADAVALAPYADHDVEFADVIALEEAAGVDLLVNLTYGMNPWAVRRFPRSALVDIDPGLLQVWMSRGEMTVAPHDLWFTTGETVVCGDGPIPSSGHRWQYVAPPVSLNAWPAVSSPARADEVPYTTVTHWWDREMIWDGRSQDNSKRVSFLEYIDLPRQASVPLELTVDVPDDDEDVALLRAHGWRVRHAAGVADSPRAYQAYITSSRGEFSCAKPSCLWLANAWVSDRTLCYLATGRPAVVQHTGPSRMLPDRAGLLRFRTPAEAAELLAAVEADYERHCREARALVECHFDARASAASVLERALA